MNLNNWRTQLRKGLLEVVVLNLLQHGQRPGYEMIQALKQNQGLKIREGKKRKDFLTNFDFYLDFPVYFYTVYCKQNLIVHRFNKLQWIQGLNR